MHTELTEMEIINQVLQGQQQAYALLVERYQNYVFTIVLRYVKTREDAEEVSQDVFIKAYRALADFKGNSKFSTWLYTIVTTTCITFLRKKRLDMHSLDNERVFAAAGNPDSGATGNQIEQKNRVERVNGGIKLPRPDEAQIITLFYKGEQSLEEI